jgi:hypothetical protein
MNVTMQTYVQSLAFRLTCLPASAFTRPAGPAAAACGAYTRAHHARSLAFDYSTVQGSQSVNNAVLARSILPCSFEFESHGARAYEQRVSRA